MKNDNKLNINDVKTSTLYLEEIVTVVDKIASGFLDRETMSMALLLFFKEKKVLDKLSFTRKVLYKELQKNISPSEYDDWLEEDCQLWKPPYDKSKNEIMLMLDHIEN
ncbi:hypothetical protein [Neisseria sp. Ec49-e6-T10]|uniref:hypothetical protein n=1 Tax=Neisseria sp. Ec49-e6-T10 TaxID=3140744 RepID=UPI003EBC4D59